MRLRRSCLFFAALALGTICSSQTFGGGPGLRDVARQNRISAPGGLRDAALQDLQAEAPGVRVMMVGDRVGRIYGVPFGYGFSPQQAALKFVDDHGAVFDPGMGALEYSGSQQLMDGKFTAVYFQQTVMGTIVDMGHLTILVKNEVGSPIVLASSSVVPVQLRLSSKRISAKRAKAAVKRLDRTLDAETEPVLIAYHFETETRFVWSFIVGNGRLDDPKRFQVLVDSETAKVIEQRDLIRYTDIVGNVSAWATPGVLPNQPNNPASLGPLVGSQAGVVQIGGMQVYTGPAGNFTIPHSGTTAVDVFAELAGRWVAVFNQAGGNEILIQNVVPPGPANFVFNATPTELIQAQVDAFIHTEAIHNFAKAINASYPGIDVQFPANVNLNNNCNAFYNGSSINFYTSGGGCPNTAYASVVYHEYGHFIIDVGHPTASSDYHEGMADVTTAFKADDPCLGRDFRGQDTGCLRNAYNTVSHPCAGASHLCGQVISGAFWLTKDELDLTIGSGPALDLASVLYLNSILLRPSDINLGVTIDVLTLDDDDGDLSNGTPHYSEIETGFGAKGLDTPDLEWVTITPLNMPPAFVHLPSITNLLGHLIRFDVSSKIGELNPASIRFVFRADGGPWQEIGMLNLAIGLPYRCIMENFACGTAVEWFIKAQDTQGHELTWPTDEPALVLFGNALTTTFVDGFDTDTGWTVMNDPGLATGAWERGDPNGSFLIGVPANPEDDSNDTGTFCAFTGQAAPSAAVGTNDVDGGSTRLTSPMFDLSAGNGVIEYQQWFFNDDGDDAMVVELSNDNGASWTVVATITYTGDQNAWHDMKIIVGNHLTPTSQMRLRLSVADEPNNSITEAAIDDFRVTLLSCD